MVPAATSIALERDRETFETLTLSSLNAGELVRGKILGSFFIGFMAKAPLLPACGIAALFGGLPLRFVPAFLVVLAAVDLCYATLGVLISSRHHKPPPFAAYIKPPTQAQLALQRGLLIVTLFSVALIYSIALLLPISLQNGWVFHDILRRSAIIGMFHPVLCLLLRGDVPLFGVPVPLWILTTAFHLLLTAPLYSKAVDMHRHDHAPPVIGPRLWSLPVLLFTLLTIAGALAPLEPRWMVLAACLAAGITLPAFTIAVAFATERSGRRVERKTLLGVLRDPADLFRSKISTAPGYLLVIAFGLILGLVLALAHADRLTGPGALLAASGLTLFALGSGLAGVAMNARAVLHRGKTLMTLVSRPRSEPVPGPEAGPGLRDTGGLRLLPISVLVLSFALPVALTVVLQAARAKALPLTPALRDFVGVLAVVALSFNPFASLMPILADSSAGGFVVLERWLNLLEVSGGTLALLHMLAYGSLGFITLAFYPAEAPDEAKVLGALEEAEEAAVSASRAPVEPEPSVGLPATIPAEEPEPGAGAKAPEAPAESPPEALS